MKYIPLLYPLCPLIILVIQIVHSKSKSIFLSIYLCVPFLFSVGCSEYESVSICTQIVALRNFETMNRWTDNLWFLYTFCNSFPKNDKSSANQANSKSCSSTSWSCAFGQEAGVRKERRKVRLKIETWNNEVIEWTFLFCFVINWESG